MRFYGQMRARGISEAIRMYRYLQTQKRALYEFDVWKLMGLGRYLLSHGEPKDALTILQFNAGEYPDSVDAQVSLAEARAGNGDVDGAIACYTKALKLDPSNRQATEALKKLQGR
jgi:predicted Zn-dependent protease